ncbi:MAG: signal peptidase II [Bacillota bacterium]
MTDYAKIYGMKAQKREIVFWIILIAGIAIDQISKYLVKINMDYLQSITIIPNVFSFTYILNKGAAWSILEGYRWFFVIIGIVFLIALFIFRRHFSKNDQVLDIALAFICVGALGNMIDRVLHGAVVDFLHFTLISFPIFNVADCFISIAVAIIIWHLIITPVIQKSKESTIKNNG